ncbi:hypothetical protein MMC25_007901 [Agyrium rufum]|nr:hypothetical protein [Agyrium rufum]
MSSSTLTNPAPYHVLAYGTLLGVEVWQSFVGGIVAYKALPRPQFATLQTALFPIYFGMQTALPILLALTYPGTRTAASGPTGVLAEENRLTVLAPLGLILSSSFANMALIGPQTTKIMRERKHQETRDGKKSYDPAPHSKEMQKLNSRFGRMHGVSSLLNMVGLGATVWYGIMLADRIQ